MWTVFVPRARDSVNPIDSLLYAKGLDHEVTKAPVAGVTFETFALRILRAPSRLRDPNTLDA